MFKHTNSYEIDVNIMKDFRNVFTNKFLRDMQGYIKISNQVNSITRKSAIVVQYKNPNEMEYIEYLLFEFEGDGVVRIYDWIPTAMTAGPIECECRASVNSRNNISMEILTEFSIEINL